MFKYTRTTVRQSNQIASAACFPEVVNCSDRSQLLWLNRTDSASFRAYLCVPAVVKLWLSQQLPLFMAYAIYFLSGMLAFILHVLFKIGGVVVHLIVRCKSYVFQIIIIRWGSLSVVHYLFNLTYCWFLCGVYLMGLVALAHRFDAEFALLNWCLLRAIGVYVIIVT